MSRVKIIVTGGAGFIGSHLVNFLIKKNFKVLVIDDLSHGFKKNVNPKANFQKIDITDSKKIDKYFSKFSPDFVFHLAAITSKSPSDAKRVKEVNVSGTGNILKACIKNNVKKIIFSSSGAVYGNSRKLPTGEKQKLSPINPYGLSKATAEKDILSAFNKNNLNYAILRYSNVYGPGQRNDTEGGVVSIFCNHATLSKPITIYGDGTQTRDFVYVDDVVSANYLSMTSLSNFTANVSVEKETSILDLVKIIEKISEKKTGVKFQPIKNKEILKSCLDNFFIKQKIGWIPKTKLVAGITRIYNPNNYENIR